MKSLSPLLTIINQGDTVATTLEILKCLFYATGSFFFVTLLVAAILNVYIGYKFWVKED